MKISDKGIALIKMFEGYSLTAYRCPAGVLTIGYGHTGDVKEGQNITEEYAEKLLRSDLVKYELKVEKYEPQYNWNQSEFDALVSFAYNVGNIDQLTDRGARSREVIADKMLQYNKAGGKVLNGLTRRREAERALFLAKTEKAEPKQKSIEEVAKEVLSGKWGNGAERKKQLKAAGYNYDEVQAAVNRLCGQTDGNISDSSTKTQSNLHKVKKGDTLSVIAKKYDTTVKDILAANKAKYQSIKANYIEVGWELIV